MSRTHYVDILIKRADIGKQIQSRLLMAVHLMSPKTSQIAVTWPDWGTWGGEFGLVFRVFGTPETLGAYKEKIASLVEHQLVFVLPVSSVPACESLVIFRRDRTFENTSPAHVRRLKRRAELRGQTLELEPKAQKCDHWIEMQSHSTQSTFRFGVKRKTATDPGDGLSDSYGLGVALPAF